MHDQRRSARRSLGAGTTTGAGAARPRGSAARLAVGSTLLLVFAALLLSPAPRASGPVIAEIKGISREGLYDARFSLREDAEVIVEGVGSGWIEEGELFAYPWILDLGSRQVVWKMEIAKTERAASEHNVRQKDRLQLAAGDYALYFSAQGGMFPVRKKISLLEFFRLGSISINGKFPVAWDEYGTPAEWRVEVRAAREGTDPTTGEPRDPQSLALVRLAENGDLAFRRAALDLRAAVRLRLLAIGEYSGGGRGFSDGAWILDRDGCRRIWEMTLESTALAGGAEKNRVFDREVTLGPGRFWICYGTDDSHSFADWNSPPPFDPESWGVTLTPLRPLEPGMATVSIDPPDENVIVALSRVGDSAFRQEGFTLRRSADVCVRAFGEQMHRKDVLVDFGWIEEAHTGRVVWSMEHELGAFAGGEARNRLVETQVHLDPGAYYVGYVTDESHSPDAWRDHPPFDPDGWGITVCGAGPEFSMDWVARLDPEAGDRTVIRLAPLRDGARRSVRFAVQQTTRVRLLALGEGDDDEMYDYGWLEREDTGVRVWEMKYADTTPAGGADKNRRAEKIVQLESGRYALHFVTDGSHAFGDWNSAAPEESFRWGVTMVELLPGE